MPGALESEPPGRQTWTVRPALHWRPRGKAQRQSGGGSIFSKLLGAFMPGMVTCGGSTTPTDDWGLPSGFQGGFSGGGDVLANRPMLVGERGPELITPRSAAHVTPNDQLGGATVHNWNIDARGATDPEAVHAAVMRAAPAIIAASCRPSTTPRNGRHQVGNFSNYKTKGLEGK